MRTDVMSTMLELYRHRYGEGVKRRGNAWNGPCPLCGGENGKSDRFMIWDDRDRDLGHTCMENHIPGVFSCRRCGISGDSIKYMTDIEGLSFREACAELGITDLPKQGRRRPAPVPVRGGNIWTPQDKPYPSEAWEGYAAKLLEEAEKEIWAHPEALKWLHARGITEEVIKAYRLGYLTGEKGRPGRFRARSVLGLQPVRKEGKERSWIFIPRGIVIPTFEDDRLINLRIRRPKPDLATTEDKKDKPAKYMELEGSCSKPMLLSPEGGNPNLRAFIVVEGELDAILCHHATGRAVGAVALRTNRAKPDAKAHPKLKEAVSILLALDYEESGAGIAGLDWWLDTYSQSMRFPTPEGKDPGNAYELGVDIREWIDGGLPETISLMPKGGQMDAFSSGSVDSGGRGEAPKDTLSGEKEGGPDGCAARAEEADAGLMAALPEYLRPEDVPPDVLRVWDLWQGVPALFVKIEGGGFEWRYSHSWKKAHPKEFEAFWRFQDHSDALWDWMSAHIATEIGGHNLLNLWG